MTSLFSQRLIEMLMVEEGGRCRYCNIEVRRNFNGREHQDNDATKDHVIAKRKGGTSERSNLVLSCRKCNHAKGDRDLSDFLSDPRSLSERRADQKKVAHLRRVKSVQVPKDTMKQEKFMRGTMAHAIACGEVTEEMTYRRAPMDVPLNPVPTMKPKHKMTALETARWLRETAEKRGRPWPLA